MRAIAAVALAASLTAPAAEAEPLRAKILHQWCTVLERHIDMASQWIDVAPAMYCVGYFNGVMGAYRIQGAVYPTQSQPWCIPNNVTSEQLMRAFMRFARDNPQDLELSFTAVVFAALIEAYPCQTDNWQGTVTPNVR